MTVRTHCMLIGLVVLAALTPGCTVNPATGEREFIVISQEEEIALGNQAAPEFEKEFGGLVPNDRLQQYVRQVGQAVAAEAERKIDYQFALLNSDVPNAFALPGGKVYVTAGLMSLMSNERQLAAVLGHEVGHVAALHNVKGLQRQMGAAVLAGLAADALGGKSGQAAEVAVKVVGGMLNLRYSRSDEYQADDLGIRYMTRAGYSPWGMPELLTALESLSGSDGGGLPEIFQTHPYGDKRVKRAQEIISKDHGSFSASAPDPHAGRFGQMRSLLPASSRASQ